MAFLEKNIRTVPALLLLMGVGIGFLCLDGCKKQISSPANPMTGDDIAHVIKPPKPIEKRLFPLNVLRRETIAIGSVLYKVIVAEEPPEAVEGLANLEIKDMPDQTGMLLLFLDEKPPAVSMDHSFFDLDVLYLDKDGVITDMASINADDEKPLPAKKAHFLLELVKGEAARIGAKVGTKVLIPDDLLNKKPEASDNITPTKVHDPGSSPATNN